MDQVDLVTKLVVAGGTGGVVTLESAIGEDAAYRIQQGAGTLCDVVRASWVVGVDAVQAVMEYADVVLGPVLPNGSDSHCI